MKQAILSLVLTLFVLTVKSQESQSAYNFLRVPVSAHAAALGGDNITLIEDDEALAFHNPALLSTVSDKTIGFNYMNYMSGANMLSAAFNRVVKERASWAVTAQYIDYGKMKETDENNVRLGEFSAKDIAVAGCFSYMLTDHLAGGVTMKFIQSYLGDYNSFAMGVDLGLNYYSDRHDLSLSIVARNLGGQLDAYDEDYDHMPFDVQVGASKGMGSLPLRVSATLVDLNHPDYAFFKHLVLGAEFLLSESIWIGGGYNFRRADEMKIQSTDGNSAHGAGLSIGAGLNLERFKLNFAYGKYHVSSNSFVVNAAFRL